MPVAGPLRGGRRDILPLDPHRRVVRQRRQHENDGGQQNLGAEVVVAIRQKAGRAMHVLDMLRLAAAAVLISAKLVGHRYGRTEEVAAVMTLRKHESHSLLEKQASDGDRQNRAAHEPPYFSSILPHDLM